MHLKSCAINWMLYKINNKSKLWLDKETYILAKRRDCNTINL